MHARCPGLARSAAYVVRTRGTHQHLCTKCTNLCVCVCILVPCAKKKKKLARQHPCVRFVRTSFTLFSILPPSLYPAAGRKGKRSLVAVSQPPLISVLSGDGTQDTSCASGPKRRVSCVSLSVALSVCTHAGLCQSRAAAAEEEAVFLQEERRACRGREEEGGSA